jgi:hypothetical protein
VKTCSTLEIGSGNIEKLQKGANCMKVGFFKRFSNVTSTPYSPCMPNNREFIVFKLSETLPRVSLISLSLLRYYKMIGTYSALYFLLQKNLISNEN